MLAPLDHLVLAAHTLQEGVDFIAEKFGIQATAGGQHIRMGTHNRVFRLQSGCYFEIIARDPNGALPEFPRWFDLDDATLLDALRIRPRLIHWVARTADLSHTLALCPTEYRNALGIPTPMQRGDYHWQITLAPQGKRPAGGALPALIEWNSPMPAERLPDCACQLLQVQIAHPAPQSIAPVLQVLGVFPQISLHPNAEIGISAQFLTPNGEVWLD